MSALTEPSKRAAFSQSASTRSSSTPTSLGLRGRLLLTGWELPENLTETEWEDAGKLLGKIETGISWWIGDWWAFGVKKYGERKAIVDADDWTGPAFDTCAAAARVCRDFETCRRRQALPFTHHREVAGLDPAEADRLLDWAEETIAKTGQPRATRELRNAVRGVRQSANVAKLRWPTGRYPLIYVDPPWRYDFSLTTSRDIENQYPTMGLEEIKALDVSGLAADDAILFMWATNPKLPQAFEVLDAWGFGEGYRTNIVWVKDKVGMGYYARGQHELLLIACRGNMVAPAESTRVSSVVCAERGEHSAKPKEFYTLIESLYPTLAKIEMFARGDRPGWDVWGNET